MRRSDDVRDAFFDCHFRHRTSCFDRCGAVIESRKYVAMYVNHAPASIAHDLAGAQWNYQPAGCFCAAMIDDLSQEQAVRQR